MKTAVRRWVVMSVLSFSGGVIFFLPFLQEVYYIPLADALAQLAPDHREVIVLRNLEGLDFQQVAQRMRRSVGAARMLWLRAMDRLRETLQDQDLS